MFGTFQTFSSDNYTYPRLTKKNEKKMSLSKPEPEPGGVKKVSFSELQPSSELKASEPSRCVFYLLLCSSKMSIHFLGAELRYESVCPISK